MHKNNKTSVRAAAALLDQLKLINKGLADPRIICRNDRSSTHDGVRGVWDLCELSPNFNEQIITGVHTSCEYWTKLRVFRVKGEMRFSLLHYNYCRQ